MSEEDDTPTPTTTKLEPEAEESYNDRQPVQILRNIISEEWEWVIVKYRVIEDSKKRSNLYTVMTAIDEDGETPEKKAPAKFSRPISTQKLKVVYEDDGTMMVYVLGTVAYIKETASKVKFELKSKNTSWFGGEDGLHLSETIDIPPANSGWEEKEISNEECKIEISMRTENDPFFTKEDQDAKGLTEEFIDLEDGDKAVISYKTIEGEEEVTKAVLYIPGLGDSFLHPHVLKLYEERGYDFYTLDYRRNGRSARFMENPRLQGDVEDFALYHEEMTKGLARVKEISSGLGREYSTYIAHAHSTGGLVLMDFLNSDLRPNPFTGFVLNSPFLEWGHVGGDKFEGMLNIAGFVKFFTGGDYIIGAGTAVSTWLTKYWLVYRWDVFNTRSILQKTKTVRWAAANTGALKRLAARRDDPIIKDRPVLTLVSKADDTLIAEEIEYRMRHVAKESNTKVVVLRNNCHDVTMSVTMEANEEATSAIKEFLDGLAE